MGCTKTVVVAGASGFIGTYLRRRFQEDGWTVRTIGRKGTGSAAAGWDDDAGMVRVLDLRELFARPWSGRATLWRPWWLRWRPLAAPVPVRTEIADAHLAETTG